MNASTGAVMTKGIAGPLRPGQLLAAVALAAITVAPVRADQTVGAAMGAMEGAVSDITGGLLPGVTVVASGGGLLVPRTATSAPRYSSLPPRSTITETAPERAGARS